MKMIHRFKSRISDTSIYEMEENDNIQEHAKKFQEHLDKYNSFSGGKVNIVSDTRIVVVWYT